MVVETSKSLGDVGLGGFGVTEAERAEYDRAVEWASWATETVPTGTSAQITDLIPESAEVASYDKEHV